MPMWLFSRGRRKRSMSDPKKHLAEQQQPSATVHGKPSRKLSSRRKRRKSSSLDNPSHQRSSPSPSPSASSLRRSQSRLHQQQSSPSQPRPHDSIEDITALPVSQTLPHSPHLRPITRETVHVPYNFQLNADSRSAFRSTGSLPVAPVLNKSDKNLPRESSKLRKSYSLRSSNAMPRRKSSRRRDPIREEEIRAMSAPLPVKRPATHTGGLLKRDSKKMRHGLNRHFERPTSDVSLPLQESLHSSLSGGSESRSYKVSAFDVLSARPTIRYSTGSPYTRSTAHTPIWEQLRSESQRERRITPPEQNEKPGHRRRIGDLAEDMDASSIREVMERDRRRREKKRKQEEEHLRQKLERRAEKQRAKEQRNGPETGTLEKKPSRSLIGLGIETPHPSTRPMHPLEREALAAKAEAGDAARQDEASKTRPIEPVRDTPMEGAHPEKDVEDLDLATSSVHSPSDQEAVSPTEDPEVGTAQAIRYASPPASPHRMHHVRVGSNISHLPALASELSPPPEHPESPEPVPPSDRRERRSSENSSKRMRLWASIFRRGSSAKRGSLEQGRATPSEASFSNTSRESMSRQPLPAHLVATQATHSSVPRAAPSAFTRRASGTPARTRSKFREDLPEFPISPPDSRVQSPEVQTSSPIAISARRGQPPPSNIDTDPDAMAGVSYGESSGEQHDSPTSIPNARGSGLVSRSLASVDSEGSWLSGKPLKRKSAQGYMARASVGSSRAHEDRNHSFEELSIPDDEYFRKLADDRRQSNGSGPLNRKPSSNAMHPTGNRSDGEQSQEDEPREVVHGGLARKPTVVKGHSHVKSREGLLKDFQGASGIIEGGDDDSASPISPTSETEHEFSMQRAKSIDLGKNHARRVSAGSARLLDIPAKRHSRGPSPSGASTVSERAFL